jgi:hypothetical protein
MIDEGQFVISHPSELNALLGTVLALIRPVPGISAAFPGGGCTNRLTAVKNPPRNGQV